MKTAVAVILFLLLELPTFAACPVYPPAEQRTRIVECTDGSYAVQYLFGGLWGLGTCGKTLALAKEIKGYSIEEDQDWDRKACPPPKPQIKTPIVVVE